MRDLAIVGAFAGLFAAGLTAQQIPAHATLLNPQFGFLQPVVVQHGDFVHAFGSTLPIRYARSNDGGRTWPVREQPLDQPPTLTRLWGVNVDANRLLVLASDASGPRLLRSIDQGSTWSAPSVATSFVPMPYPTWTRMYADGQNVVVAFTNDRPNGRVFCNRSIDGGLTWQPADTPLDLVIGSTPPTGLGNLHCFGAGPIVHVVWAQNTAPLTSPEIYHQRSLDGGVTWRPVPVHVAVSPPDRVAATGSSVFVADFNGALHRSLDHGDTWSTLTGPGFADVYDVQASGTVVATVSREPLGTYAVNVSTDLGQSWQPNSLVLPEPGAFNPRLHFGNGRIYLHFLAGSTHTGAFVSANAGASWQLVTGPVSTAFEPGERRNVHVATPAPLSGLYYAYVGVGTSTLGASTAGSGGIAPELTNLGLPLQGSSFTLQVERALGGSLAALGVSFAVPAATPLGTATIWLGGTPVLFAYATGGASGVPGAGSFGKTIAVPVAPSLVGASLTAQALVFDAGAFDGFTVTNAVEVWLR